MKTKRFHSFVILSTACLAAASSLSAQEGSPGWSVLVDTSAEVVFETDLKELALERSVSRGAVEMQTAGPLANGWGGVSLAYIHRSYSWDTTGPVGPPVAPFSALAVAPYDTVRSWVGTVHYRQDLPAENWGIFARGGYEWSLGRPEGAGIPRASWGDAGRAFGTAGLSYTFSPDLRVSFGALYLGRLERSDLIVPILFVDWRINEHWRLLTTNGVRLHYDLNANREHVFSAGVEWDSFNFAYRGVREDGSIWRGAGSEQSIRATVSWQWQFHRQFSIRPEVGYLFAQKIRLRESGSTLDKQDIKGSFLAGISLQGRF